ncbi:UPF0661 TPR repeat-containing protein C16D10.01c-like [Tropilaelaps mercedesae]|uniref:UPF0661 TPR repeat-containing protein C16D10.01c-like n=1 Tax=Tropilaelaps mercedesae TaxID=418985 RepID=A0A1V9WZQ3_9ACAR|nr:UPF0661 TPR repeat-containing protein C16D10.01c-like [Tropilaelaps mercedesae]
MGRSAVAARTQRARKAKKRLEKSNTHSFAQLSAEELAKRGEQLADQGQYAEARKLLAASLEKKVDPDVMFTMACCLIELSRPEEAKQMLVRSCELSPDTEPNKWLTLAELQHGNESLRCFEKATELLKRELTSESEPVAMDEGTGQTPADNQERIKKLTARKLSSVYVCISELFTTGGYGDAESCGEITCMLACSTSQEDLWRHHAVLIDLCDEPDAEVRVTAALNEALELDSSNPEVFQAKANYHMIKGELGEATVEMKRSLDLWLPLFDRTVEGGLDDSELIPQFNVRLSAAKMLLELKMFAEATTVLDGLVLEDEDCVDAWYLLGWLNFLRKEDYLPNAKFYLKKALRVRGNIMICQRAAP